MPPKRKNGTVGEEKSSERKKQKLASARVIAVQPVETVSLSKNATSSESVPKSACISSSVEAKIAQTVYEGLHGLPSVIDVERFAEVFLHVRTSMVSVVLRYIGQKFRDSSYANRNEKCKVIEVSLFFMVEIFDWF
jgi:hypothetical protein